MTNASALPEVNGPATVSYWTDCYAGTVVRISKSGSKVVIAEDESVVVSGSVADGSAKYEYRTRTNGRTWTATRRGDGTYRLQGFNQGGRVGFAARRTYQDPSF